MTGRAWAAVLILGGLLGWQISGGLDDAIEHGQGVTRSAVAGIQSEVGQMLAPRQGTIDQLTAEIDALSE